VRLVAQVVVDQLDVEVEFADILKSSAGVVEAGSSTPGSEAVLPPNGTAWLSATFRVLATCPSPLAVQFSVRYRTTGGRAQRSWRGSQTYGRSHTPGARAAPRQLVALAFIEERDFRHKRWG
jgi:hypothetical protein